MWLRTARWRCAGPGEAYGPEQHAGGWAEAAPLDGASPLPPLPPLRLGRLSGGLAGSGGAPIGAAAPPLGWGYRRWLPGGRSGGVLRRGGMTPGAVPRPTTPPAGPEPRFRPELARAFAAVQRALYGSAHTATTTPASRALGYGAGGSAGGAAGAGVTPQAELDECGAELGDIPRLLRAIRQAQGAASLSPQDLAFLLFFLVRPFAARLLLLAGGTPSAGAAAGLGAPGANPAGPGHRAAAQAALAALLQLLRWAWDQASPATAGKARLAFLDQVVAVAQQMLEYDGAFSFPAAEEFLRGPLPMRAWLKEDVGNHPGPSIGTGGALTSAAAGASAPLQALLDLLDPGTAAGDAAHSQRAAAGAGLHAACDGDPGEPELPRVAWRSAAAGSAVWLAAAMMAGPAGDNAAMSAVVDWTPAWRRWLHVPQRYAGGSAAAAVAAGGHGALPAAATHPAGGRGVADAALPGTSEADVWPLLRAAVVAVTAAGGGGTCTSGELGASAADQHAAPAILRQLVAALSELTPPSGERAGGAWIPEQPQPQQQQQRQQVRVVAALTEQLLPELLREPLAAATAWPDDGPDAADAAEEAVLDRAAVEPGPPADPSLVPSTTAAPAPDLVAALMPLLAQPGVPAYVVDAAADFLLACAGLQLSASAQAAPPPSSVPGSDSTDAERSAARRGLLALWPCAPEGFHLRQAGRLGGDLSPPSAGGPPRPDMRLRAELLLLSLARCPAAVAAVPVPALLAVVWMVAYESPSGPRRLPSNAAPQAQHIAETAAETLVAAGRAGGAAAPRGTLQPLLAAAVRAAATFDPASSVGGWSSSASPLGPGAAIAAHPAGCLLRLALSALADAERGGKDGGGGAEAEPHGGVAPPVAAAAAQRQLLLNIIMRAATRPGVAAWARAVHRQPPQAAERTAAELSALLRCAMEREAAGGGLLSLALHMVRLAVHPADPGDGGAAAALYGSSLAAFMARYDDGKLILQLLWLLWGPGRGPEGPADGPEWERRVAVDVVPAIMGLAAAATSSVRGPGPSTSAAVADAVAAAVAVLTGAPLVDVVVAVNTMDSGSLAGWVAAVAAAEGAVVNNGSLSAALAPPLPPGDYASSAAAAGSPSEGAASEDAVPTPMSSYLSALIRTCRDAPGEGGAARPGAAPPALSHLLCVCREAHRRLAGGGLERDGSDGEGGRGAQLRAALAACAPALAGLLAGPPASSDTAGTCRACAAHLLGLALDLDPEERRRLAAVHGAAVGLDDSGGGGGDGSVARVAAAPAGAGARSAAAVFLAAELQPSAQSAMFAAGWEATPSSAAGGSLVLTPTTSLNLEAVRRAVESGRPLLLCGDTGVGKSAAVPMWPPSRAPASSVGVADLLYRHVLRPDPATGQERFALELQPFAAALRDGHWLLLDELNLAPDNVLLAIEQALDLGFLQLPAVPRDTGAAADGDSEAHDTLTVTRAPSFRLFATQNPRIGLFRDKRERQSAALLSRFQLVVFSELPADEWQQVLAARLSQWGVAAAMADDLAARLVDTHMRVAEAVKQPCFAEARAPYAQLSIRELLRWAQMVAATLRQQQQQQQQQPWEREHGAQADDPEPYPEHLLASVLAATTSAVYPARFRLPHARQAIAALLPSAAVPAGRPAIDLGGHEVVLRLLARAAERLMREAEQAVGGLAAGAEADDASGGWGEAADGADVVSPEAAGRPLAPSTASLALQLHCRAVELACSIGFVRAHGLYFLGPELLREWLERCPAADAGDWGGSASLQHVLQAGLDLYAAQLRSDAARADLASGQPVLLTGAGGSGKSECLRALAALLGLPVQEAFLTAESEAATLVGQYLPSDRPGGPRVAWADGAATLAVHAGQALLAEGLGDADATVLERLNPLLESPPCWVLTERGDTLPAAVAPGFRVLATLATRSRRAGGGGAGREEEGAGGQAGGGQGELSPALANRFCIVHMADAMELDDTAFAEEVRGMCAALYGGRHGVGATAAAAGAAKASSKAERELSAELAARLCVLLRGVVAGACARAQGGPGLQPLTLRLLVRLLECAHELRAGPGGRASGREGSFAEALWVSYTIALQPLLGARSDVEAEVSASVRKLLLGGPAAAAPAAVQLPDLGSHILTPTRRAHAAAVAACVRVRLPVLLEGPPAVGKTSLVAALASAQGAPLLRINNSEGTQLQDYLGTYLPASDGGGGGGTGFRFHPGPLTQALENGQWLLVDELNLARPEVIALLCPLLEGRGEVRDPLAGRTLRAHPGFRLFATQNSARGASAAGRHPLPPSLRARLVEVQVPDFEREELASIIQARCSTAPAGDATTVAAAAARAGALQLADAYGLLRGTPHRITLRELLKAQARSVALGCSLADAAVLLLGGRVAPGSAAQEDLMQRLRQVPGWEAAVGTTVSSGGGGGGGGGRHATGLYDIVQVAGGSGGGVPAVRVTMGALAFEVRGVDLRRSPLWRGGRPPQPFVRAMAHLLAAVECGEPVLLQGPSCYKSLLVRTWCELTGRLQELQALHLTSESETADLVGRVVPCAAADLLHGMPQMAHRLLRRFLALTDPSAGSGALGSPKDRPLQQLKQEDVGATRRDVKALADLVCKELPAAIASFEEGTAQRATAEQQRVAAEAAEEESEVAWLRAVEAEAAARAAEARQAAAGAAAEAAATKRGGDGLGATRQPSPRLTLSDLLGAEVGQEAEVPVEAAVEGDVAGGGVSSPGGARGEVGSPGGPDAVWLELLSDGTGE
ncbi:Midasin, partial [Tetrabaena socialis]